MRLVKILHWIENESQIVSINRHSRVFINSFDDIKALALPHDTLSQATPLFSMTPGFSCCCPFDYGISKKGAQHVFIAGRFIIRKRRSDVYFRFCLPVTREKREVACCFVFSFA